MSTDFADASLTQIRETIGRLQSPIPDLPTLFSLLAAPLACIGLLPPRFRQYNDSQRADEAFNVPRHIPPLQRTLLEHVIPTWEPLLVQESAYELVEQYFCPDAMSFASPAAGQIALYAYSTLLSVRLQDHAVRLLAKLCKAYPVDVLHSVLFSAGGLSGRHSVTWEDCVRDVVAVPAKVANYMGDRRDMPAELELGPYYDNVSARTETLIFASCAKPSRERIASIAYLLGKLVNVGALPPLPPISSAQPSFFRTILATIRARIASPSSQEYSAFWVELLGSLTSSKILRSVLTSLLSCLRVEDTALDPSSQSRALMKQEAQLLKSLIGPLTNANTELSECISAVALGRTWSEGFARVFACWAAGAQRGERTREGLNILLTKAVDLWTDSEHIRHALLSQHRYLTALLLITLNYFPAPSPAHELALSSPFIQSISTYISHLDPSVRRCGMLVAEEVARASGKTLDFGEWDGDDQDKAWYRQLRESLKECDADADDLPADNLEEVIPPEAQLPPVDVEKPTANTITVQAPASGYDSDDSLTGYGSPASSRSASPTPSELADIEKDPTLGVGLKKVPRPVYLAQLGELVRPTSGLQSGDEQNSAAKMEVALEVAEELIRRKSGYGTELEENAVNLVYGFIGLQDNYDLEDFSHKRQAALNALVACCPRKAAPTLIEQFFTNQYSTDQRFAMLNALGLGAQELASLSIPGPLGRQPPPSGKAAFPSKRLPPSLHKKYLTTGDQLSTNDPINLLLDGISQLAVEKSKDATADKVPEFVRERDLRIRGPAKATEVSSKTSPARTTLMKALKDAGSGHPQRTTFTDVAAEFFIWPLISRFWLFLRDEQTREERTAHQPLLHRYQGAATGLVLSALVLGRMLETLAVLVHAARNAREWLAVVAPDALELAITLGTRPISRGEGVDDAYDDPGRDEKSGLPRENRGGKEAALLTAALELALIVLDGCLDLDGGRSLGLEHTTLLVGCGGWADKVFGSLEEGAKMLGGGGVQEIRLRRAAAAVVLKVDELTSKWRRSMVDMSVV